MKLIIMRKKDIDFCINEIITGWMNELTGDSDKVDMAIRGIIQDIKNDFESFDETKLDYEIEKLKKEYEELRRLNSNSLMYVAGKITGLKIAKEIIFGSEKEERLDEELDNI